MKTSTFIFILVGCSVFFGNGNGKYGTLALAFLTVGLAAVGAFLLVNGY